MDYKKIVIKYGTLTNTKEIPTERLVNITYANIQIELDGNLIYAAKRGYGELQDKSIYLPHEYDWVLGKDSQGCIILIPLKKER